MAVRRGAARLAVLLTLVAGLLPVAAAPAVAAEDRVGVRLPSRFTAGGSPGSVSVSVSKRTDGCVSVRTALAIRLKQLPADQVTVEVSRDGQWRALAVSTVGDGLVVTEHTAPARPVLCRKKSLSVRYRVSFLAGAPGGEATLVAEAYTGGGGLIGRAAGKRSVVNPAGVVPTPSISETPAVAQAETAGPGGQQEVSPVAGQQDQGGGFTGLTVTAMLLGLTLVGIGIGLLVMLVRRARAERDEPTGPLGGYPSGMPPPTAGGDGDQATRVLPRVPY